MGSKWLKDFNGIKNEGKIKFAHPIIVCRNWWLVFRYWQWNVLEALSVNISVAQIDVIIKTLLTQYKSALQFEKLHNAKSSHKVGSYKLVLGKQNVLDYFCDFRTFSHVGLFSWKEIFESFAD